MIRSFPALFLFVALAGCGERCANVSYYHAAHLVDIETRRRDEITRCLNLAAEGDERAALQASFDRQCGRVDRALALRNEAERREFGECCH